VVSGGRGNSGAGGGSSAAVVGGKVVDRWDQVFCPFEGPQPVVPTSANQ